MKIKASHWANKSKKSSKWFWWENRTVKKISLQTRTKLVKLEGIIIVMIW